MPDQSESIKRINNAGKFSFWFALLHFVVLLPLSLLTVLPGNYSAPVKIATAILCLIYFGGFGLILFIYGRRLRNLSSSTPDFLEVAAHSRSVLLTSTIVFIVLTFGGALLHYILLLNLIWTGKAIKNLRAQSAAAPEPLAAPTFTPPAAPPAV